MATSPEGTAEGWGVGLDLSRPFGTRDLLAPNPALKRWAILACPFGTARQRSSHADKRPRCPAYDYWSMTRLRREREFTLLCTSSCGLDSLVCSLHSSVIATTKGAGNAIAETKSRCVISTSGRGFSYVRFQRRMVWPFAAAAAVLPVQTTDAFGVSFGSPESVNQSRKSFP